jgi:hypothetical protein
MEVQIVRNSAAEIDIFYKKKWLAHKCLPRQNTSRKQRLEDA